MCAMSCSTVSRSPTITCTTSTLRAQKRAPADRERVCPPGSDATTRQSQRRGWSKSGKASASRWASRAAALDRRALARVRALQADQRRHHIFPLAHSARPRARRPCGRIHRTNARQTHAALQAERRVAPPVARAPRRCHPRLEQESPVGRGVWRSSLPVQDNSDSGRGCAARTTSPCSASAISLSPW